MRKIEYCKREKKRQDEGICWVYEISEDLWESGEEFK
jgi:hypothetical protein